MEKFMKKMKLFAVLAATVGMLVAPVTTVQAATGSDTEYEVDYTGNAFFITSNGSLQEDVKKDAYVIGNQLGIENVNIGWDTLTCGYNINISNSTIGGSLRAAGYSVDVSNTEIEHNVTAAGYSVSLDKDSKADAVYAFGDTVTINGTCEAAKISASTAIIGGEIKGDAQIAAEKIIIDDDARIGGKLTIISNKEPKLPDNLGYSDYSFEKIEDTEGKDIALDAAKKSVGAIIAEKIMSRLYWIPALCLIAFLFCLFLGKALKGSAEMVQTKPGIMLGSGAVGIIALPVGLIITCLTFIGLPLAGLITLIMLPIMFFAVTFAGAALGRIVFKQLHPWLASIIGTAILVAVRIVPFVGGIVGFAALIFTLGYVIQIAYEQLKEIGKSSKVEAATEDAEVVADAAVVETEEN